MRLIRDRRIFGFCEMCSIVFLSSSRGRSQSFLRVP